MKIGGMRAGLAVISILAWSSSAQAQTTYTTVDVRTVAPPGATDVNGSGGTRSVVSSYTAGHSETAVTYTTLPYWNGGVATVNGAGYSNLATGSLGALAQVNNGGFASATSIWSENLTFNVSGATSSTITDITLNFLLHGTLAGAGTGASFSLYANGGQSGAFTIGRGIHETRGPEFSSYDANWKSFQVTPTGDADTYSITAVLGLIGVNPSLTLANSLYVFAESNGVANFMNTASLSLGLPNGVTYTSQSGVFLSQVSGVPEPASWAMMLGGFGMVGGAMRYRRRRTKVISSTSHLAI